MMSTEGVRGSVQKIAGCYHVLDNFQCWGVCKPMLLRRGRTRGRWAKQHSMERCSEGVVDDCYQSMDAAIGEEYISFR